MAQNVTSPTSMFVGIENLLATSLDTTPLKISHEPNSQSCLYPPSVWSSIEGASPSICWHPAYYFIHSRRHPATQQGLSPHSACRINYTNDSHGKEVRGKQYPSRTSGGPNKKDAKERDPWEQHPINLSISTTPVRAIFLMAFRPLYDAINR